MRIALGLFLLILALPGYATEVPCGEVHPDLLIVTNPHTMATQSFDDWADEHMPTYADGSHYIPETTDQWGSPIADCAAIAPDLIADTISRIPYAGQHRWNASEDRSNCFLSVVNNRAELFCRGNNSFWRQDQESVEFRKIIPPSYTWGADASVCEDFNFMANPHANEDYTQCQEWWRQKDKMVCAFPRGTWWVFGTPAEPKTPEECAAEPDNPHVDPHAATIAALQEELAAAHEAIALHDDLQTQANAALQDMTDALAERQDKLDAIQAVLDE